MAHYFRDRDVVQSSRARNHRADTILKPSAALSSTHIPTEAAQIESMVLQDLQYHSHVADTDEFLKLLLDVEPDIVDKIYDWLVHQGDYSPATTLWRGFPTSETKPTESALYGPFTAAANAVNDACAAVQSSSPISVQIKSAWLDRHSTPPKSRGADAPAIRPDVVCVLGATNDIKILEEKIRKTEEAEVERMLSGGTKPEDNRPEAVTKAKDLEKIWWHRVHVPVEVKLKGQDEAAVRQLCGYMRQVFREQLDRRFALGLAFCASELSVWLCDRSGLVGTQTPFDIHKEPKKFIQVVAALALLTPDRLGYDLSMTLYRPDTEPRFVHSWDPSITTADFDPSAGEMHWAFEMPNRDGTKRERFISVRGLNLVLGEIMCGRATLVWEVVKEGVDDEDKMRYVLKQCWRPMTSRRESFFYEKVQLDSSEIALNIGAVYSSEDVHVKAEEDNTCAIRCGLAVLSTEIADAPKIGKRDREDTKNPFVFIKTTDGGVSRFSAPAAKAPNPRVLSRMVMETYGWPIKFFKDIPELLKTMRDSIRGHRALYYSSVLHRDVSVGNILICPEDNDVEKTHGTLIDLDYAKFTEESNPPIQLVSRQDWDDDAKADYAIFPTATRGLKIDEGAFYALWVKYGKVLEGVTSYIRHISKVKDLQNLNRSLTVKDLDIYYEDMKPKQRPDFSKHTPQKFPRTATLPFASYEILKNQPYARADGTPVMHDSIHDMESFFWILVYLCLTRKGPSGSRRDELKGNTGGAAHSLEQIVYCFFDAEDINILADNRKALFNHYQDMQEYIVTQFHPYFDVLKPLALEWWRVLHFSYIVASYEPMHQPMLEALERTIEELVTGDSPYSIPSKETTAELQRRREDLDCVRQFREMQRDAGIAIAMAQSQPRVISHAETSPFRVQSDRDSYRNTRSSPPASPTVMAKKHKGVMG